MYNYSMHAVSVEHQTTSFYCSSTRTKHRLSRKGLEQFLDLESVMTDDINFLNRVTVPSAGRLLASLVKELGSGNLHELIRQDGNEENCDPDVKQYLMVSVPAPEFLFSFPPLEVLG